MRAEDSRQTLRQMVRQRPFQQFLISLENGDRMLIEHPENLAFDPTDNGKTRFSVVTQNIVCYATLESVASVIHQDTGSVVGA